MGRKSADATKVRFIRCARVAVTFLRGRWLELAVFDFLCVDVVLDLCAAVDFWVLVADEDFFFWDVDALSCANSPPVGKTRRKATEELRKKPSLYSPYSV